MLIVGDFFSSAMKTRLIDIKAQFPKPVRMPLMASAPSPDDWHSDLGTFENEDPATHLAPGTGVIVRQDGGRTLIGDAGGIAALDRRNGARPAMSSADVGSILSGMGRDPVTGERLGSSSGSSGRNNGASAPGSSGSGRR